MRPHTKPVRGSEPSHSTQRWALLVTAQLLSRLPNLFLFLVVLLPACTVMRPHTNPVRGSQLSSCTPCEAIVATALWVRLDCGAGVTPPKSISRFKSLSPLQHCHAPAYQSPTWLRTFSQHATHGAARHCTACVTPPSSVFVFSCPSPRSHCHAPAYLTPTWLRNFQQHALRGATRHRPVCGPRLRSRRHAAQICFWV